MNSDLSEAEIQKIIDEEVKKIEDEKATKLYPDWKPGQRKRPLVMSYRLEDFEDEASGAPKWTLRDKRCGALAIKVGMMPVWDKWGERHPCTVLYLDNNVVIRNKTSDSKDGYDAVQIGAGERKAKRVKKPQIGHFNKYNIREHYPWIVREFRVTTKEALPPEGSRIHARHFSPGQNVDISGVSKGKGFQGGMKRHGFKGMPASHGTSKSHRAIGSTGMCQDPGRVFKGKKMPGRMGGVRVTKQNLRIVKIDRGRNLIYVRGAVPGNKGEFVEIRDAVKKPLFGTDKCEGGKDSAFPSLPTFLYEEGVDGSGVAGFEVMMPMQEQDPLEIVEEEG
jgi:large subunit ribosomal protein L3